MSVDSLPGTTGVERICGACGASLTARAGRCPLCGAVAPGPSSLEMTDPAPAARRAAAVLIDLLPLVLLGVAALVLSTQTSRWWLVGAAGAYLLALWAWAAATGQGPGKALTGLRVVDQRTGRRPGAGAALLRLAARAVIAGGTLGIAGLSYRWDPAGREQTWWDRLAGSRVLTAVPATAEVSWSDPVEEARWTPAVSLVPRAATPAVGRSSAEAGPIAGRHSPVPLVRTSRQTERPISAGAESPAEPPADHSARSPRDNHPDNRLDNPVDPSVISVVPVAQQRLASPSHRPPAAPDPAPDLVPGSVIRGGEPDPVPSGRHAAVSEPPADATVQRTVSTRGRTVTLVWDTGRAVLITGHVLVGREPVADAGETLDQALAVDVDSRGVSKTHLALDVSPGGVTVTDRHSTNGVRLVRPDGTDFRIRAGEPVGLRDGDRIEFGGRSLTVSP